MIEDIWIVLRKRKPVASSAGDAGLYSENGSSGAILPCR